MNYRTITLSFFMMLVIGSAAFLTLSIHPDRNNNKPVSLLPDAYMEDVNAVVMDKQGKVSMKINTPKMVHFTDGDITELQSPHLIIYRKSPIPWYVNARFAKAFHGTDIVDFWDDVVIHQPASQDNPSTVIKTSTLRVYPNQQTAETKDDIKLIQPNTVINATGMFTDMNTGSIKLLSNARGEYVPS